MPFLYSLVQIYAKTRDSLRLQNKKVKTSDTFPEKFRQWQYLGKIDEYDVELIIGTIRESPRENAAHLALYGL